MTIQARLRLVAVAMAMIVMVLVAATVIGCDYGDPNRACEAHKGIRQVVDDKHGDVRGVVCNDGSYKRF